MVRSEEERKVYLACRPIFTHQTALLRKRKKIRELVNQHKIPLGDTLAELGEQKLVKTLEILLYDGIFQSDSKAKEAFPEIFQSSPVREIQRSESEIHAVQSVVEALKEIEGQHSSTLSEPLKETVDEIKLSGRDETSLGDFDVPQDRNKSSEDEIVVSGKQFLPNIRLIYGY